LLCEAEQSGANEDCKTGRGIIGPASVGRREGTRKENWKRLMKKR
jgi:hypothetical protein